MASGRSSMIKHFDLSSACFQGIKDVAGRIGRIRSLFADFSNLKKVDQHERSWNVTERCIGGKR